MAEAKVRTINEVVAAVMSEVGAIGKDKKNAAQGFMFRGIDQVMNSLHETMAKHGLFVIPELMGEPIIEKYQKEGGALMFRVWCKYKFHLRCASDEGRSICGVVLGEAMDSGDKASNKCISVALKYFLLQTFMIPTEDMKDPDAESPSVKRQMISATNLATLNSAVAFLGDEFDKDSFYKWLASKSQTPIAIGKPEEIPDDLFPLAMAALEKKAKQ